MTEAQTQTISNETFSQLAEEYKKQAGLLDYLKNFVNRNSNSAIDNSKCDSSYLSDDHEIVKQVKIKINNYVGQVEKTFVKKIEDGETSYNVRAKVKNNEQVKVSEFLTSDFCKENKISRFSLMTSDEKDAISCTIDKNNLRYYNIEGDLPIIMTLNWYVGERKCTIKIELGTKNNVRIIERNGVSDQDLAENKDVRMGNIQKSKSLVEALSVQSFEIITTIKDKEEQQLITFTEVEIEQAEQKEEQQSSLLNKVEEEQKDKEKPQSTILTEVEIEQAEQEDLGFRYF
ncbi:hypothetical protein [Wolbachia endosymbiont of Folsomia candida]|uniref:hypothetical protein n=1 Tax=Wolbachia endosymbiont of Folsomia candida TaxID=169402 RepID=UPI001300A01E|nr:hypothetical protein [Wolbachia endosymbiont of Folsomia candida]